jgi:hypothetical protein
VEQDYREPYPGWVLYGMDVLAAGILLASFRDAWAVVRSLGAETSSMINNIVAAAVVLAIDASILLFEQARSQIKLRGGNTRMCDLWVSALIVMSAILNVRYLTQTINLIDQIIAAVLGVAIPSTIAVLGYIKGDMLAFNAFRRRPPAEQPAASSLPFASPFSTPSPIVTIEPTGEGASPGTPKFRLAGRRTAAAAP